MSFIYIVFSSIITALANLLIRRGCSFAKESTSDPFIPHRFLTAAIAMLPIIFFLHGTPTFDWHMLSVGIAGGLALGLLQFAIGKSLHYGPPALSFIFISGACVVPPIIMSSIFGHPFGHSYSLTNFLGSLLVLTGLFWMTKGLDAKNAKAYKKWVKWISIGFAAGALHMLIIQWRALLLKDNVPSSWLLPYHPTQKEADIYIVTVFLVAALCQLIFNAKDRIKIKTTIKQKALYGIVGGAMSSVSSLLLILGAETAASNTEKALLFPLNTVLLISLCNLWAKLLYKEQVNWKANALSLTGIAIAAV